MYILAYTKKQEEPASEWLFEITGAMNSYSHLLNGKYKALNPPIEYDNGLIYYISESGLGAIAYDSNNGWGWELLLKDRYDMVFSECVIH